MAVKPELLVPLNDWKTLAPKLKVLDNANSVYFGIQSKFSMRAHAGNFKLEDIPPLVRHVHDHGDFLYICTNIVVYSNELKELRKVLEIAKVCNVDAVICYDFASIQLAKELGIKFHISTQMNVSNVISAQYFESIGASRINLARELNLEQIKEIINTTSCPIECFVHGAMCTAVSGRCYLSAELMGFSQSHSANRGKCAHQCRRFYSFIGEDGELLDFEPSTGRFFNAKDLCMIEYMDFLIDSGISAFKIEGRMRDPLYISETTKCYREAIDSIQMNSYTREKKQDWIHRLMKVYNRGFHTGFYFSPPDPNDIELRAKGNTSLWKRKMVGRIIQFRAEDSQAIIDLSSGSLQKGDTIIIQDDSGFYSFQEIYTILVNGMPVHKTDHASAKSHILASISTEEVLPIHSKVFKIHQVQDPIHD